MRSARLDHPRSRGVYPREVGAASLTAGSSPLARGLQRPHVQGVGRQGIIPARAGFTPAALERRQQRGDHPRSRGVYPRRALDDMGVTGSSPLARGLRRRGVRRDLGRGIIPARAGFTIGGPGGIGRVQGSSPLARGLRLAPRGPPHRGRIIPARAGFTRQR